MTPYTSPYENPYESAVELLSAYVHPSPGVHIGQADDAIPAPVQNTGIESPGLWILAGIGVGLLLWPRGGKR